MTRPSNEIRMVPLDGFTADVLEKLAELLAGKPDVPAGIVYLVGRIPPMWDLDAFEVD